MTTINMQSSPPKSLTQITTFLQVSDCKFSISDKKERNSFIRTTTWNLKYKILPKKHKGLVIKYFQKLFSISNIQAKRLVKRASKGNLKAPKSNRNKTSFKRKYSYKDIELLAQFDDASNYPNGFALQANLTRMVDVYHDQRFLKIANISHGHIYNLRKSLTYQKYTLAYQHTKPVLNNEIGIREKPSPIGPGYLRVDTVHGGDLNGNKGVYYVNLIDELTQWEIVICVQGISEHYLGEVFNDILNMFPFEIKQFHSDNGSEFINKVVANLLNKLNIRQSKGRPRHSNDNSLAETKNGSIIRKHFGYAYVQADKAPIINNYLHNHFNEYLNYHRTCAFPTKTILDNGKIIIKYKREDYKTPYSKLKELDPKGLTLKTGLTYMILDNIAMKISDFDCVVNLKKEYQNLLKLIL